MNLFDKDGVYHATSTVDTEDTKVELKSCKFCTFDNCVKLIFFLLCCLVWALLIWFTLC